MSCSLSIIGKELDIDAFILKSKIVPHKKRYKGEPRMPARPNENLMPYSYILIETSKADFHEFEKQIEDTISYLTENKEKLELINQTKEVEYATLDFGIDLKIDMNKILHQTNFFPKELLRLCGLLGLGIELSIYPKELDLILEERLKNKKG